MSEPAKLLDFIFNAYKEEKKSDKQGRVILPLEVDNRPGNYEFRNNTRCKFVITKGSYNEAQN